MSPPVHTPAAPYTYRVPPLILEHGGGGSSAPPPQQHQARTSPAVAVEEFVPDVDAVSTLERCIVTEQRMVNAPTEYEWILVQCGILFGRIS